MGQTTWARRGVVGLVLGLVFSAMTIVGGTRAALAEGPLRYEAHSTYTVDPAAGVIHVLVDLTVTNNKPNSNDGVYVTQYYWSEISVPMLATATNLAASRDGGGQGVRLEPTDSDEFAFAIIDLSPNIYYRDTAHVQFTYDLPSGAPRSDATTRVNEAYASFWAFPVADPNLTSVRIRVPKSYEVEWVGDDLDKSSDGTYTLYESGAISDPLRWGVIISARNDNRLTQGRFRAGEHAVLVRGWPDDPEWSRFVTQTARRGIPRLERLIGIPWFNDDRLTISETVSPYLYGYAGWYQSDDNTIEIGDALDADVVLHEISHIWFNDELFDERWIGEGFAQTYSNLALEATGESPDDPKRPRPNARGAQSLNEWGNPNFRDDEETRVQEEYGYNAAWYVIDEITDEIGTDKMREVFIAAEGKELSFLGDPEPETVGSAPGWQRFLDLLELRGGSEQAVTLFTKYVVSPGQRRDMRDRQRAHRAYTRLSKRGGEWTPPLSVRRSLTQWGFARAEKDMALATEILALRDQAVAVLDGTGVELPASFETAFETSDGDLDKLRDDAEQYLADAKVLAQAHADADAEPAVFAKIGLLRSDYEDRLDAADESFTDGDTDDAAAIAATVSETIDDAEGVGQQRVGFAAGGLVLLVLMLWFLRRWRRKRRARKLARSEAAAAAAVAATPTTAVVSWGSPATWAPRGTAGSPRPAEEPDEVPPPPPAPSESGWESGLEPPHPA